MENLQRLKKDKKKCKVVPNEIVHCMQSQLSIEDKGNPCLVLIILAWCL